MVDQNKKVGLEASERRARFCRLHESEQSKEQIGALMNALDCVPELGSTDSRKRTRKRKEGVAEGRFLLFLASGVLIRNSLLRCSHAARCISCNQTLTLNLDSCSRCLSRVVHHVIVKKACASGLDSTIELFRFSAPLFATSSLPGARHTISSLVRP